MSKTMNEFDHFADANTVDGPIERVMSAEIMETFKYLVIGKAPGSSEVNEKMILTSGDVGIRVLMELCQRTPDGKGMQEDWATSVAIPILKEKEI